jgi:hypothetical protein
MVTIPSLLSDLLTLPTIVGLIFVLVVVFYSSSTLFWIFETVILASGAVSREQSFEWGLPDIQARVVTVDNAAVVQGTVDALPDAIGDVRVIAERDISVEGAEVDVVPAEFSCQATHKGRALEWARRNVPCDQEYVLYLDEDTIVANLSGLPDSDVIQFTELPLFTGSRIAYLCEVFRIGFQYEQRAFARLKYPLYVWGGGIAIRKSVEDRTTWDRSTITEDTAFVWSAVRSGPLSFTVVDGKFRNQAPATIRGMFRQRRRWMSGTRAATSLLPLRYRAIVRVRAVIWGLSPLIVLFSHAALLVPASTIVIPFFDVILIVLVCYLHLITVVGARIYGFGPVPFLIAVVLTIPLVTLNTAGALWGLVSPVSTFKVTEKVAPQTIEQRHPALNKGDISNHSGTAPFGDPSAPFQSGSGRPDVSEHGWAGKQRPGDED